MNNFQIIDQSSNNKSFKSPVVSIICYAYNHDKYIRETLDGFISQQTNFPFEIVIHDDASTDNTALIIREYELKYPHLFKAIYQKENQYSQEKIRVAKICNEAAKGRYIAMCEGDDYWTDTFKLQKQVDFLEKNTDYVLCFHDCMYMKDGKLEELFLSKYNFKEDQDISSEDFQIWLAQTATIVYRNNEKINERMSLIKHVVYGDVVFRRVIVEFGKIFYINEVMSVYRKHIGGITHGSNNNIMNFAKIKQFKEMKKVLHAPTNQPIAKSYYFISKSYLIKKNFLLSIKYLCIAFSYDPLDIMKRIKIDIKNQF